MDGQIRIVCLKGSDPVGAWEFGKETVTIGRSKSADVRLDDAAISRLHCTVEVRSTGVFIKDNGSRNGIWVNGRQVTEGLVAPRDEIIIEHFTLKAYLVWGDTAARHFTDREELRTNVGPAARPTTPVRPTATPVTRPPHVAPAAAAAKPSKPASSPKMPKMELSGTARIPVAQPMGSLEETGAMEVVAPPLITSTMPKAIVRPSDPAPQAAKAPKAAKAAESRAAAVAMEETARVEPAKPKAKPISSAKPVAKLPAQKALPPAVSFDDYDEDDEEETLAPAFSMTDLVAGAKIARPLEGKAVVEVIRYRGVNVLEVTRLNRGQTYLIPFSGIPLVSFDGENAELKFGAGMSAEVRKGGLSKSVTSSCPVRYGELMDVTLDDTGYLIRVAERVEVSRSGSNANLAAAASAVGIAGGASISIHLFVAAVFMVIQMLQPEKPEFSQFARIEMPKEPLQVAKADPTPEPTPRAEPTPPPAKQPKAPPEKLARRPVPRQQPVGGAEKTEAKVASAGVLGGLGKVNVKLDSPNTALAAVTNLDAVRSTSGHGGGFKVSALTGKVPGDAVLGRAGRATGTVDISTLTGNDLGARGGFGGHSLNGGKVRGVVTQTPTSNVGVQGTLSREEIAAVVNKHLSEIRRCYEKNLINDPSLAGKIQVEWTINPDGTVAAVKTKFSSMKSGDVTGCMSGSIRTWQFPRPKGDGYVIVNYPFNFDAVGF